MEAPLALYRRYRPETFAEVIGQDHVTEPLRAALASNRVNHAYLFSGPRGCGKTTSARILARALNCEQEPVAEPCGECDSCRDLARNGPGSIDVIEIDAASHGGVDDARDLREKAFFAPVKSRYKVYIIDEAHMVSTQGFNALLKLVEEPPEHLRFIFATTEPEKVLPTIRSRTHHYPFRLIPPRLLSSYLGELCEKEGVAIAPAALPLVVRAGAGSARDTLSVLDQLLGGAGPDGVTHALATGLLGYTPDTLLDEVVDAFAAADGGAVFGVVDKIIETGQDPRRFAEDLLRRLRDLVIVAAVPDAPATGLIDCSEDQGERLVAQAARFGGVELSRAADLVASGLTEMRGATAPRLLLELICARVLLPGADDTDDGVLARLDRIERRLSVAGTGTPSGTAHPGQGAHPAEPHRGSEAEEGALRRVSDPDHAAAGNEAGATQEGLSEPQPTPTLSLVDVRRLWPDIVEATKQRRRVTWIHLTQHAQVVAADESSLTLGFGNAGARDSFANGGSLEIVRQAAIDVVGKDWRIDAIVDPAARPPGAADPVEGQQRSAGGEGGSRRAGNPAPEAPHEVPPEVPPDWAVGKDDAPSHPATAETAAPSEAPTRPAASPNQPKAKARESLDQPGPAAMEQRDKLADAAARRDDADIEDGDLAGAELLQRRLGAEVIEEIPHD